MHDALAKPRVVERAAMAGDADPEAIGDAAGFARRRLSQATVPAPSRFRTRTEDRAPSLGQHYRVKKAVWSADLPPQHWAVEFELAVGAAKRPRTTTHAANLLDFPDRRCTLPSTPRRSEKRLVYGEGDRPPELDGRHESVALLREGHRLTACNRLTDRVLA